MTKEKKEEQSNKQEIAEQKCYEQNIRNEMVKQKKMRRRYSTKSKQNISEKQSLGDREREKKREKGT